MESQYHEVMLHLSDGTVMTGKAFEVLQRNDGLVYVIGEDANLYVVPQDNVLNQTPPPGRENLLWDIGVQIGKLWNKVYDFALTYDPEQLLPDFLAEKSLGEVMASAGAETGDELDLIQYLIMLMQMNDGPSVWTHSDDGSADVLDIHIYHQPLFGDEFRGLNS